MINLTDRDLSKSVSVSHTCCHQDGAMAQRLGQPGIGGEADLAVTQRVTF